MMIAKKKLLYVGIDTAKRGIVAFDQPVNF